MNKKLVIKKKIVIDATLIKKTVLMLIAVSIMGICAAILDRTNAGPDPFTAMNLGASRLLNMPIGNYQLIFNIILLLIVLFGNRKLLGLGTLGNMVVVGYFIQFTNWLMDDILHVPTEFGIVTRVVVSAIALLIFVAACSVYLNCDLGAAPYDALPYMIHNGVQKVLKREYAFKITRMCYDGLATVVALLLGGSVGPLTVGMVVLLGPTIDLFNKWMKKLF
ncbi:MAG: hypothetical protein IJ326_09760 [Lachnospiraceae bacterium]|nr:hypothetical protein [Lachnospiraceae bacterium]